MRTQYQLLAFKTTILALGLLICGCSLQRTAHVEGDLVSDLGVVAVLPFENYSGNPNAGLIISELFRNELYASKQLHLVPAALVSSKLQPLEGAQKSPDDLGKLLKAKTLVMGRVTEYTYKTGLGEDPAVGVSIRVVDAETGRVIWSGARSDTGRYSWVKEDSLSRLSQYVCARLAKSLLNR